MAKTKFYAIRKGIHPETKQEVNNMIFTSWDEAKLYVTGVKGAEYKSFTTEQDANMYLQNTPIPMLTHMPDVLYAYVDGSYNKNIPNYSFGLVCVCNEQVVHHEYGAGKNKEAVSMHQIAGELLGAMKALLFAKKHQYKKVVILHDYEGVRRHATGEWKHNNEFSKTYFNRINKFLSENDIVLQFSKVDAHTGNDFNELADGYAKIALGLEPNPIFFRMEEKYALCL